MPIHPMTNFFPNGMSECPSLSWLERAYDHITGCTKRDDQQVLLNEMPLLLQALTRLFRELDSVVTQIATQRARADEAEPTQVMYESVLGEIAGDCISSIQELHIMSRHADLPFRMLTNLSAQPLVADEAIELLREVANCVCIFGDVKIAGSGLLDLDGLHHLAESSEQRLTKRV